MQLIKLRQINRLKLWLKQLWSASGDLKSEKRWGGGFMAIFSTTLLTGKVTELLGGSMKVGKQLDYEEKVDAENRYLRKNWRAHFS